MEVKLSVVVLGKIETFGQSSAGSQTHAEQTDGMKRGIMELVNFFALFGTAFNDVLAVVGAVGSLFLLILYSSENRLSRRLFAPTLASVFFGIVSQIAIYVTDIMPERFPLLQLTPGMVNGLLGVSVLFLLIRLWLKGRQ